MISLRVGLDLKCPHCGRCLSVETQRRLADKQWRSLTRRRLDETRGQAGNHCPCVAIRSSKHEQGAENEPHAVLSRLKERRSRPEPCPRYVRIAHKDLHLERNAS